MTLSFKEKELFLDFVQASQSVFSYGEFDVFVRQYVRPLFPHGMTLACVGAIVNGKAVLEKALTVDYPAALVEKIHRVVDISDRSLLARWYQEKQPQLVEMGVNDYVLSEMERGELNEFGFNNFAAHGVVDLDGKRGSYFSFAGIPGRLSPHHSYLMSMLAPHLHQVLVRIVRADNSCEERNELLSPREVVVLKWIAVGKSNKEISVLLNRRESTIRNQVHSILQKLGAASRAEALLKAHEFRLVSK